MPARWTSLRKILSCKQDCDRAVHDPKVSELSSPSNVLHSKRRISSESSCSKSCRNLRNVIHGNTRVVHRPEAESPPPFDSCGHIKDRITLSPLPEWRPHNSNRSLHSKKFSGCYDCSITSCDRPPDSLLPQPSQPIARNNVCCYTQSICQECGENFNKAEALEGHRETYHRVTELDEGDSARSIVEIIFQTSWLRRDIPCGKPDRIFKVHNDPKVVSKFEEYRDMVKVKANKLPKKHSRCLADGNELLRFHSTTVACTMAKGGTSSLCASTSCGVCQILRFGFRAKDELGIYTTASSGRAHDSVLFSELEGEEDRGKEKRAMLVCRVIAGRVKKLFHENSQEGPGSSVGYDSVAGEAGQYSHLEELLIFNAKAVLPCFVVIYSC